MLQSAPHAALASMPLLEVCSASSVTLGSTITMAIHPHRVVHAQS
eukprot:COSAG06_NODE_53276_length_301_cov_0.599010_1_plen_44_part_01